MNTFINVKKEFKPNLNFWELNPHLRYVRPFSELYAEDTSKDKDTSSKHMWCVFYLSEPDENINLYYRLPLDQLIDTCKNFNPNFDYDNELIQNCIKEYPETCLTVMERMLKITKDLFKKRTLFLKEADYDFSTMKMIDSAIAATPKLEQDFDNIVQKYAEEQNKEVQLIGGRKQSAREKRNIRVDLTYDTEFRSLEKQSDSD